MKKFFKTLFALLISPLALSATATYALYMWRFAVSSFADFWSFWLGWLVCPIFALRIFKGAASRIYVAEHEATHAIFALITGARVKKISIKKDNGAVVVDKANTLITLAPYFFPLFASAVFVVWATVSHFVLKAHNLPLQRWSLLAYFLAAAALSFHFFMTLRAVMDGQSDIRRDGALYSFTVIFLIYVSLSAFFMKFMFGPASGFNALGEFFAEIFRMAAGIYVALWKFFKSEILPELRQIFV